MTWVKLDDQFFAHPKIVNLDKDAKLLYLAGLTYCAGQLTDGLISAGGLRVVLALVEARRQAVTALVTAGLWEAAEGGAYQVHDYLEYNPSADQVKHDRQQAAQRQAEWRERKGAARVTLNGANHADSNAVTNGISQPENTALVTGAPYRSHPVQDNSDLKEDLDPRENEPVTAPPTPAKPARKVSAHATPKPRTTVIPDDWPLTDALLEWWDAQQGPSGIDPAHETEKWQDYHRQKGTRVSDWAASWRNWMRKAIEFYQPPPTRNGSTSHAANQRQSDKLTSRLSDTAAFLASLDDGALEDPGRDRHPNVALLRARATA
jgi:hypothetical protein